MKTYTKSWISALILAIGAIFTFTQCEKDLHSEDMIAENYQDDQQWRNGPGMGHDVTTTRPDPCACLNDQYEPNTLNETEVNAILFMREEEKLARDVYAYLFERWNVPVFNNIAKSEVQHMAAIGCLIERYGLTDPVANDVPGVFVDTTLATWYQTLTEEGNNTLGSALTVGATIEDLDIYDLMGHLENDAIDNKDVRMVFNSLTKGSRNHLRAFSRLLENEGVTYTPAYISTSLFREIIESEVERGGGLCVNSAECTGSGQNGPGHSHGDGICDGTGQSGVESGNPGIGNGPKGPGNGKQKGRG